MISLASTAIYGLLKPFPTGGVGTADPKPWTSNEIDSSDGLRELAFKLNPAVGYWDPMNLFIDGNDGQEAAFQTKEAVAWFRHAEIKHGRVAMAAFVGYCVQSQGIVFPGMLSMPLKPSVAFENTPAVSFADVAAAGAPPDQWDALPTSAKVQILLFVGFLELFGESTRAFEKDGTQHYVRGGKPGYYPKLLGVAPVPLNLYDPFGFSAKASPEKKAKGLLTEINNGRLAMLGIFGFMAESKVQHRGGRHEGEHGVLLVQQLSDASGRLKRLLQRLLHRQPMCARGEIALQSTKI